MARTKNPSERFVINSLESQGYTILKRGWPDLVGKTTEMPFHTCNRTTKMKTRIEVYRSKNQFYWRAWRGAKIVCDGSEGYKRRAGLLKSLKRFLASIEDWQYVIEGEK